METEAISECGSVLSVAGLMECAILSGGTQKYFECLTFRRQDLNPHPPAQCRHDEVLICNDYS